MRNYVALFSAIFASMSIAVAGPLQPAHLPAEAKWVLHLDLDGFRGTLAAEKLREQRTEMIDSARVYIKDNFGVDFEEDLHGLTIYGNNYKTHSGAAVVYADYEMLKLKVLLDSRNKGEPETWEDKSVYTFSNKKRAMTVILHDKSHIVFASSPELAKATSKLLQGSGESLKGKESPLTAEALPGAVAYGAAVDLQQITEHEGAFPILKQHQHIVYALGDDKQHVFEYIELVAVSEDVARDMQKTFEGILAFSRVWSGDSKPLQQAIQDTKVSREGTKVVAHYRGTVDDARKLYDEFLNRFGLFKKD